MPHQPFFIVDGHKLIEFNMLLYVLQKEFDINYIFSLPISLLEARIVFGKLESKLSRASKQKLASRRYLRIFQPKQYRLLSETLYSSLLFP